MFLMPFLTLLLGRYKERVNFASSLTVISCRPKLCSTICRLIAEYFTEGLKQIIALENKIWIVTSIVLSMEHS